MTTLYLIRHAHNEFVKRGKLAGRLPDVHLNSIGTAQAEKLAELFTDTKLTAVYSSPLERSMETALPLAKAQGLKVIRNKGLLEIDFGSWQGSSLKALRRRKLWPRVQFQPSTVRFPQGESFAEAQFRIVQAINQLVASHNGKSVRLACVSHADPIKLAIAHFLGLSLDHFQRLSLVPASVSSLHISEGHIALLSLNDSRAAKAE
jgi:probable phosphoglycerate mutase